MGKHSGQSSVGGFLKGLYSDSYKWDIIKSIGFFALGIKVAQSFVGVEIMPSMPQ
ncbi:uncharacterized protein LOC113377457 [Ctenocephalides felis]|uniref:uncharacterized protein LOC113377457 n=1 Tax=Ctenocephalides felis TaxID=7515 RepID=UPI000E6E21F2|nr:uncharacterized protein LOC113377457 [Ctenocephalides felis]